MKHFQSLWVDLEVSVILWLPRVDNISIMAFISELHKDEMTIFFNDYKYLMISLLIII